MGHAKKLNRLTLPDWNLQQNRNVLAHLGDHGWRSFGMKLSPAASPIHALQLIDKHGPFHASNGDRQREWIWLDLAGQGTNHGQTAGAVVAEIGEDERGPALSLFAANLFSANVGIKVQEDNVAGIGNVLAHHSTASLPTSGPSEISA
jgi:hypothetical protein